MFERIEGTINYTMNRRARRERKREEERIQRNKKKEVKKLADKIVSNPYFLCGFRLSRLAELNMVSQGVVDEYWNSITNAYTEETIEGRDEALAEALDWGEAVADVYENFVKEELQ